jgi:hypothetical protein
MAASAVRCPPAPFTSPAFAWVPDMTSQPVTLEHHNFRSQIDAAGDAIVRVTEGTDVGFPTSIIGYFDTDYPATFKYFTIRRDAETNEAWWTQSFTTGDLTLPQGRMAGSPGFYLFIKGEPVEWSTGRTGDDRANAAVDIAAVLLTINDPTARQRHQDLRDARISDVVTNIFESYLQRNSTTMAHLQAKAEPGRIAKAAQAEEDGRRMLEFLQNLANTLPIAGANTPKRAYTEDYELLDVTPNSTDEAVEQAHHNMLKRNDPELLAHMDPELQALATRRTKMINSAMRRIQRARGR